ATRFDRVTSGLWAPRATAAPCCCGSPSTTYFQDLLNCFTPYLHMQTVWSELSSYLATSLYKDLNSRGASGNREMSPAANVFEECFRKEAIYRLRMHATFT
ncbi:hypothetical protein CVT26_008232, partial [Gymnopilus dilepis]